MGKWVVAAACGGIYMLILGAARMVSLLFVASMERYNSGRKETSLPYVLCYVLRNTTGPLIGILGKKYDVRSLSLIGCFLSFIGIGGCFFAENVNALVVLWGVVFGIGFSFATTLLTFIIDVNFDENKSKGQGLSIAGATLGGIVLPPILDYCINIYGLSGTFLILAGLVLHSVPACLLLPSKNSSSKAKQDEITASLGIKDLHIGIRNEEMENTETITSNVWVGEPELQLNLNCSIGNTNAVPPLLQRTSEKSITTRKKLLFTDIFRLFIDPTFWLLTLSQSLSSFVTLVVWTVILDVVRDKGIDRSYDVSCLVVMTFSDLLGRCCLGHFTDAGYISNNNFCIAFLVLEGLSTMMFVWVYSLELLMTTLFLFSLAFGGLMAVMPATVCEFIVKDYKILALASRTILMGPLTLTVSPLIGYFRETHGSYDGIFYLCGIICICCGVMATAIPTASQRSRAQFEARCGKQDLI